MPKRFTDTDKWDDPWFDDLNNQHKLLYLYILDNCDHAGIWKVNKRRAGFSIKGKIGWNEFLEKAGDRIIIINEEKWFIRKFIIFQYGKLKNNNPAHISVLKILDKHGLLNYSENELKNINFSKKVPKKLRYEVFKEFKGICAYCDEGLLPTNYHVNHITPISLGGKTEKRNLALSCYNCNIKKSEFLLDFFIKKNGLNKERIYSKLRELNKIITIAPGKGLISPTVAPKDKDKDKDKDNNINNKKENYNYENQDKDQKEIEDPAVKKMIDYINSQCPNIKKMTKQLTLDEAERLNKDYKSRDLRTIVDAMENSKNLSKKYTSVNLTIRNWLRHRGIEPYRPGPKLVPKDPEQEEPEEKALDTRSPEEIREAARKSLEE